MGTTSRKNSAVKKASILAAMAQALMQGGGPGMGGPPTMMRQFEGNGFYVPRYHTSQTYRSQQRAAKQRRRSR